MSKDSPDPYTKLATAIVLHGLMERDQSLISTISCKNNKQDLQAKKFHRAREANAWTHSHDFDRWCGHIGLDPVVARRIDPKRAKQELRRLIREGR